MKTNTISIVATIAVFTLIYSCSKQEFPKDTPSSTVALRLPEKPYQYNNRNAQLTTLGRVLFYDKQLSINNSISCGTCHKQALAFSDNVAKSTGFESLLTDRNTPPIQNLGGGFFIDGGGGNSLLFWDGRETFLPSMVMKPIANHIEMGVGNIDLLIKRIEKQGYYRELFQKAYGDNTITSDRIAEALALFTGSISSRNTIFDQATRTSDKTVTLNGIEKLGMQLFVDKYDCNSCHQVQDPTGYLFEGGGFANIGLDVVYPDKGRANVTNNNFDNGSFKIPSLRNVALTGPYMHDGRFETLEDVIKHYSVGLRNNENLDFRLRDENGKPLVFNINEQETKAIVAFLNTLTDYSMITDPKFSDPFVKQ